MKRILALLTTVVLTALLMFGLTSGARAQPHGLTSGSLNLLDPVSGFALKILPPTLTEAMTITFPNTGGTLITEDALGNAVFGMDGVAGTLKISDGGTPAHYASIVASIMATDQTFTLPSTGGTIALLTDITAVAGAYLPLAGGTMTGDIAMGTHNISGAGSVGAATMAVDPGATNVASMVIKQTSAAVPSTFVFAIEETNGTNKYFSISPNGQTNIGDGNTPGTLGIHHHTGGGGAQTLITSTETAVRNIAFPDNSGTVALLSDVTSVAGAYLPLAGGTMSGNIAMGGKDISGAGTVTATSFSGPLTGNVTGNVSGTSANVTGIVALANGGTGSDNSTGIAQHAVFAGPSGAAGAASFRALVASDLPSLSGTYLPLAGGTMSGAIAMGTNNISGAGTVTATSFSGPLTGNVTGDVTGNVTGNVSGTSANVTGIVALANGGTGSDNSTGIAQHAVFAGPSGAAGAASFRALVASDLPSLSGSYLPLAGGTMSGAIAMGTNNISGAGTVTATSFSGPLTGNVTGDVTGNLTGNVTGNVSGTSANVTGIVALANGGTGSDNSTGIAQHAVFAGPSGAAGAASFRALVASDLPSLSGSYLPLAGGTMSGAIAMGTNNISGAGTVTATSFSGPLTGNVTGNVSGTSANVTGIVALANGGTGSDNSTGIAQHAVFAGPSGAAGAASFRALDATDIPSLSATYLPLAGGTMSGAIAMGSNNISGGGTFTSTTSNAATVNVGTVSTTTGTLTLANASSANATSLQGGNATAAITYTLPTDAGTSGQVLTTGGGAGPVVPLTWSTVSGGSGTGTGTGNTGNTFISRNPLSVTSKTGASSNTAVNVAGIAFPIGAGEIWSFRMELSTSCATNANGMDVGVTVPSGAVIEGVVEGLVDLGAGGHTTFGRITSSGSMVGPFNKVADNDAGLYIYATVDNSAGSAGTVQLQMAAPASGDAGVKTVYKNSFVTAWQYGVGGADHLYSSNSSLIVPAGVTKIYIAGVGGAGGGGGGGGKNSITNKNGGGNGGGGGAGEYITSSGFTVTPGETLTITVGAGGTSVGTHGIGSSNTAATAGGAGGVSSVVGSVSGTLFSANGGTGGGPGGTGISANVGAGGTAGAGGVTAGSTPLANGTAGNNGVVGSVGTNNGNATTGGAGGSGPTGANANTGGAGGGGGESNVNTTQVNGSDGGTGTAGYIEIAY